MSIYTYVLADMTADYLGFPFCDKGFIQENGKWCPTSYASKNKLKL